MSVDKKKARPDGNASEQARQHLEDAICRLTSQEQIRQE